MDIAFFDTEVDINSGKILDIGAVKENGDEFHSVLTDGFINFLQGSQYVCGHNILTHDLKYIKNAINKAGVPYFIDTLYLSPLLFPEKPYHALLKDDKLQTDDINNPLNDSKKARDLFYDEITAFSNLEENLKQIFFALLKNTDEFCSFFKFIGFEDALQSTENIEDLIQKHFNDDVCGNANLTAFISNHPIELAYCLSLINTKSRYSITPPWVLKSYPIVENIMHLLRNKPCLTGCHYCDESLNINKGLKQFFGYENFRTFAGEPLQEMAVNAAVHNKSILAVFPTGGGKSITFQLPALMSGVNSRGLTVVISPLQSLMKDQVDNLEKNGITDAVTINGLLDPIERAKSIERVEDGSAFILYISPESLRSKTIERILLSRNIVRFVIDEAHCFSSWGHDFRVDYLYIGDFIKKLQEKKNLEESIPVSCFTATAKQKVINDIKDYFKEKLSLNLDAYTSAATRKNLKYCVFNKENEEDKYNTLRNLIEEKNCPTIVYVSRTGKAQSLATRLTEDGFEARAFHGQMDKQEKVKNQDAFIKGDVQIIVATSAFGMGVDKKDVGLVIHFDISDSLENYVQEAGRAGRDESITAECYILYNDEDLNKHFILLNQTKLSIKEIQQVWKAIKNLTKIRSRVSKSALEIARTAGWDENVKDIETRVTIAIAALENSGYLKRGQNMPKIYANSILAKNVQEAVDKINASQKFSEPQRINATRIIKKLIASKSRAKSKDFEAESRVDYISDQLGIVKNDVIQAVTLLREERILADYKDLSAYIRRKEHKNRSLSIMESYCRIERYLLSILKDKEQTFNIKELNEGALDSGCEDVTTTIIKTIFNYWVIKNWVRRPYSRTKNHITVSPVFNPEDLEKKLTKRQELSKFIIEYLFDKSYENTNENNAKAEEILVEFSVLELKEAFENVVTMFDNKTNTDEIEDALFYMSKIDALKIEGGFLVTYNAMEIERLEPDSKKRYKADDYKQLEEFYKNKIQQIHIVGEYAQKMISDYKDALQFVDDYFQMNYSHFLSKYFKGSRQNEISKNITPAKFKKLFGELSPAQLNIIKDNKSQYIVVAAGPGSGKTRVLAHKLASLSIMEDVKHEQMLMVTFSRAAATEFKTRLFDLIGNAANFIEIKTFHSYCFDILGRVGTIEKSGKIVRDAVTKIRSGEVEQGRITKTVLVIDEAQDMDADEFELINALMEQNEDMRVIAVGDDDQNIYEFRGSSSKYLESLIRERGAMVYELVANYRSKQNIVDFANLFASRISHRIKKTPIQPVKNENGIIKIVRYDNTNLIEPLVNSVLSEMQSGSTCVLTDTNDDALQITGLIIKRGYQAKLIQSNEGFNLYNLDEIRYFLSQLNLSEDTYTISKEAWNEAKRRLIQDFSSSSNLEVCVNILKDFENMNPRTKYKSDLEVFIRESGYDDFYSENNEAVFVSTIHKAKGREFDNVFLMLSRFQPRSNEDFRTIYVALTRAKNNLFIHYNGNYFDFVNIENIEKVTNPEIYQEPDQIALQLGFRDIFLGYFQRFQYFISKLYSGDELTIDGYFCHDINGKPVLKFSKQFISNLDEMKQKNYIPKKAKIRFIVFWKNEDTNQEIRIILPDIYFEKANDEADTQI